MKVLIVCNFSSGLYTFRGRLIGELIAQGHDVTAIVPLTSDVYELAAESKLADLGCALHHAPMERRGMNPIKDGGFLLRNIGALLRLKPDLVITYTIKPNIYANIACRIVNGITRRKTVCAVNITGLGTAFEKEGALKRLACLLYKCALKKVKVVFFENEANCQTMVDLKLFPKERAVVLAGAGVDLERFQGTPYPTEDDGIRFLFIGRVMQEKGIDELFDAMERLHTAGVPCRLDVVGLFEEDYSDKLAQYTEAGWLHYHGYQEDVRPFIRDCHCFVLPSWHEGMANTNLECAAMGRPIITSAIPGCREAVVESVSGLLCEPRNVDSLFDAMYAFSHLSASQREQMGMCGRKHIEDHFDKKTVVHQTIQILSQISEET